MHMHFRNMLSENQTMPAVNFSAGNTALHKCMYQRGRGTSDTCVARTILIAINNGLCCIVRTNLHRAGCRCQRNLDIFKSQSPLYEQRCGYTRMTIKGACRSSPRKRLQLVCPFSTRAKPSTLSEFLHSGNKRAPAKVWGVTIFAGMQAQICEQMASYFANVHN